MNFLIFFNLMFLLIKNVDCKLLTIFKISLKLNLINFFFNVFNTNFTNVILDNISETFLFRNTYYISTSENYRMSRIQKGNSQIWFQRKNDSNVECQNLE